MKHQFAFARLALLALLLSVTACTPPPATPTATPAAVVPSDTSAPPDLPPLTVPPTPELTGPAIQRLAVNSAFDVTFIRMVSQEDGWAIGGANKASDHVFLTWDGGLTWRDVTPPEPAPAADAPVAALGFFKDAATAWVVYGPAFAGTIPPFLFVWRTSDGGATWQYGTVDTSIASEAFSPWYLVFSDSQNGWLMVYLGAGMMHNYVALFATHDGGATWTDILDPFTDGGIQSFSKTDFVFVDAQTGWLTRDSNGVDPIPHVFRTTDGGVTWTRLDLPAPPQASNLFADYYCGTYTINRFSPASVIVAVKCEDIATLETQLNFQYATTDGGATWQIVRLPEGYTFNASNDGLFYFDPNYGFALGRNIYQTTDGGQNWTLIKQVAWDGQFSFYNMNLGWAVARSDGAIALVKTTNGGAKWEIINPHVRP
ncbi:MAG: Uncharacterized protein FD146_2235 [Anaerolineaceae bacterium]|nr:MAG: Uncharacterized protein FD146_2235 [Anaerolineaceae bacterium]